MRQTAFLVWGIAVMSLVACGGSPGSRVPQASCSICSTSWTQAQCESFGARSTCATSTLRTGADPLCGAGTAYTSCEFTDCNSPPSCG